jgi:hypothetical protein
MSDFWDDAEIIHSYTRAQAIADGVLVAVPEADASEAGFRLPMAMTVAAHLWTVAWTPEDEARKGESTGQSERGRLWDVLYLAALAGRHGRGQDRVPFVVAVVPRDGTSTRAVTRELVLHIGPGDAGEPVLTIMLPGED